MNSKVSPEAKKKIKQNKLGLCLSPLWVWVWVWVSVCGQARGLVLWWPCGSLRLLPLGLGLLALLLLPLQQLEVASALAHRSQEAPAGHTSQEQGDIQLSQLQLEDFRTFWECTLWQGSKNSPSTALYAFSRVFIKKKWMLFYYILLIIPYT